MWTNLTAKPGAFAEIKDEIITIFTYLKLYEETEIAPTPEKTPDKTPKPTGGGGIKFPPTTSSSPTTPPASQTPGDKPQSIPKPPAAQDTQFADVNQHWSKDYAAPLVERNIIVGYEDGNFAPDQPITRQEFAVILVRALGLTEQAAALTDTGNFADGASIADWSKNSIALLSQMGILTGYDDGEFKPAKNINREEMAVLIARCVKNDDVKTVQTGFLDKDAISRLGRAGH